MHRFIFFLLIFLESTGFGQMIITDPSRGPRRSEQELSPQAGMYGIGGLIAGVRYTHQLLPEGFIAPINDSVNFDGGGFVATNFERAGVIFSGGMRWDFHLSKEWTVFGLPEIRVILADGLRVQPGIFAGGLFHYDQHNTFRLEFGTPLVGMIGYVLYL